MKILKTDSKVGFFLLDSGEYESIDKLDKENLLRLVDQVLEQDAEFDEYSDTAILNPAHQIIYKSVYGKLRELALNREQFKDETKRLYLDAYEKYCDAVPDKDSLHSPEIRW